MDVQAENSRDDISPDREDWAFDDAPDELTWYLNNFMAEDQSLGEAIRNAEALGIEKPEGWIYFLNGHS